MKFELSIEFKQHFEEAMARRDDGFIMKALAGVNPADIASLLDGLTRETCKHAFDLLPPEIGAEVLVVLEDDVRRGLIGQFTPGELASFVGLMDSDDGTDLLHEMNVADRNEVIRKIEDEEKAAHLMELLEYNENVAGGLMAKELIRANREWNILQCIEEIRKQAENVEKIYSVYVVNNDNTLLGKVAIQKIILARDDSKVADIYDDELVCVETSTSQEEVADTMQKYDLVAVPVVNARGGLVGRITIDDVVDVMRENAEEERQLMTGVSADVEEDDSVWRISKARLPWLIIGMSGGLVGARFMDFFKEDIILVPALAFFVPLITASGGNVGVQSSSIVVQSLASHNVFVDSTIKRLLKVFLVAIVNGIILSLIVFCTVAFFMRQRSLATTVSIALFAVVLLASFMGTVIPLLLNKFRINPAIASGPFITTTNDLLGLGVYFYVAHLVFNL